MNKMNTISIIALILIFFGGVGAILLTIGQSISSSADKNDIINTTKEENRHLKTQLDEIKRERDLLSESLEKRDENISNQNKSIIDLSNKLADQSDYIQNFVTGGKGFPIISLLSLDNKSVMFKVRNKFDFPLYNVETHIFNYDIITASYFKRAESPNEVFIKLSDYLSARIAVKNWSELPANEFQSIQDQFPLHVGRYLIKIQTRNQSVYEKLVIIDVDGIFRFGFQIFNSNHQLIYQSFDENLNEKFRKPLIEKLNSINEITAKFTE